MNQNLDMFENILSFRNKNGSVGVRAELNECGIPAEIKDFLKKQKSKKK